MIPPIPARLAASTACFVALGGAAFAQDGSEHLTPPLVIEGTTEDGLYLYGQIDKGVLVHDDGRNTESYFPVDNGNSSTRFGAWLKDTVSEGLRLSANFEFEWTPYSTGYVNQQRNDVNWDDATLRKAEGILDSDRYGRVWLGQGSMASDGSSEADLSGTGVAAYSSIADSAGGQLIAFAGNAGLSEIQMSSAFGNLDGLGRAVRARYDTPSFGGIRLQTSVGTDLIEDADEPVADFAVTYGGTTNGIAISAAAAYANFYDDDADDRRNRLSASLSALHEETGLNLTLATGYEDRRSREPVFFYGKLGWQAELTSAGTTAFAVDAYSGSDFAVADSDSLSFGFVAVQTLDYYRTDLFITARIYDFDEPAASYERAVSMLTGARWQF